MITKTIAEQALSYCFDALPADVVQMAKATILDTIGCAMRGNREPCTQILAEELYGRTFSAAELLQIADEMPTETLAALLFGTVAHAIDFDDGLPVGLAGHVGVTVISAVLMLAAKQRCGGQEIMTAVVAGYETAGRVGALLKPDHYKNGFHTTATVCSFGATAACANLLNLTTEQTQMALGIMATQASGIKAVFGTMTKPFNAGKSASNGVLAAKLASKGFTCTTDALEAEKGFLDLYLGLPAEERHIPEPDEFHIRTNIFKFHASCLITHSAIDGANYLKSKFDFGPDDVEQMRLRQNEIGLKTASIIHPTTGLESKFSTPQTVAFALAGYDTAADETFGDAMIENPEVNGLRQKIDIMGDNSLHLQETAFEIKLTDGRTINFVYDGREYLNTYEEIEPLLVQKFLTNSSTALGADKAQMLLANLQSLEHISDYQTIIFYPTQVT